MNSLSNGCVVQLLDKLHEDAEAADRDFMATVIARLEAAGLADLVDIREGDALETLEDVGGEVDVLLIDGAWSLYLSVLTLIEPR